MGGNISPPSPAPQSSQGPNPKRCQEWKPTGEFHQESRWNAEKQTMETVSVPNYAWQEIPCQ